MFYWSVPRQALAESLFKLKNPTGQQADPSGLFAMILHGAGKGKGFVPSAHKHIDMLTSSGFRQCSQSQDLTDHVSILCLWI